MEEASGTIFPENAAGSRSIWTCPPTALQTARAAARRSGLPVRVEDDHFVYAAGTIETTRLLLLLDREAEGRAFETCDALGASFQDHLDAEVGTLIPADVARTHRHFSYHYLGSSRRSLHLVMSPRCQEEEGVAAAYASILIDFDNAPHFQAIKALGRCLQSKDLSVRHLAGVAATAPHLLWRLASWRLFRGRLFLPPEIGLKLHICAEQVPRPSNRITLSDRVDRFGVPLARIAWSPHEEDERTCQATRARLSSYWRHSGLARFCHINWSDEDSARVIDRATDFAHPSGSTRMGVDPKSSVVAANLRCWHVRNATVVSASVVPSAGSSNPTCTIMQLALRAST